MRKLRTWITVLFTLMLLAGLTGFQPAAAQDDCIPGYDASSYTWGSAGPSPCSLAAVVELLDLYSPSGAPVDLAITALFGKPGNPTPIGWVVGTTGTEAAGTTFGARHVPNGTVNDYDPRSSNVTGEYQYVDFRADWRRALLTSDGSFEGLKVTIYWTPTDWAGLTPQTSDGSAASSGQPTPASGTGVSEGAVTIGGDGTATTNSNTTACPADKAELLKMFEGNPSFGNGSYWTDVLPDGGYQYTGPTEGVELKVGKVNDVSGLHNAPFTPTGQFTWYPCA